MSSYTGLLRSKSFKVTKNWFRFLTIFILSLFISCGDTPTCLPTETNLVKIAFVDDAGIARQTTFSLRAIDYNDLFLDYTDTTLSKLVLPLNPTSNSTTLVIDHDGISDTLGLKYIVIQKLISPECGLDIGLSDLDTTFTTFDNLKIVERIIFEDVTTNIEITL